MTARCPPSLQMHPPPLCCLHSHSLHPTPYRPALPAAPSFHHAHPPTAAAAPPPPIPPCRKSGPQGSVRPFTIVRDPKAWMAADMAAKESEWLMQLTAEEIGQFEAAVAAFTAAGRPMTDLKRAADFPLPPALEARLAAGRRVLMDGVGVFVVRGLPVKGGPWSERESLVAYMGLAAHLGYRTPWNKKGSLVSHVKAHYDDVPGAVAAAAAAAAAAKFVEGADKQGHATNLVRTTFLPSATSATVPPCSQPALLPLFLPGCGVSPSSSPATACFPLAPLSLLQEFDWHTDAQADVLGLLCMSQGVSGGMSGWTSALAVHNELLRRGRGDLVACLAGPGWGRDRTKYQDLAPGEQPFWEMPGRWAGGLLVELLTVVLCWGCDFCCCGLDTWVLLDCSAHCLSPPLPLISSFSPSPPPCLQCSTTTTPACGCTSTRGTPAPSMPSGRSCWAR